ncbi:MAG: RHS repeat-associated core domain-containing protein [Bacteroidota bacterium]
MKNRFRLMLGILCLFYSLISWAQIEEPAPLKGLIPAAPTAQELGKYGEVPVNLYNGLTQVSIPLMELDALHLSMPVSLSYHASGLKVDQLASWVGMGWSLNAGGVITREIRDQPDDAKTYTGNFYCDNNCQNLCFNCDNCGEFDGSRGCLECGEGSCYRDVTRTIDQIGYLYNGQLIDDLYHKSYYTADENMFLHGKINRIFYGVEYGDIQEEDLILDFDLNLDPQYYLICRDDLESAIYNLSTDEVQTAQTFFIIVHTLTSENASGPLNIFLNVLMNYLLSEFNLDPEYLPYIDLEEFFAQYPDLVNCFTYDVLRPEFDVYDTEPDVFNFNFAGYSGQFVFDRNGEPKLFSTDDLRIEHTLSADTNLPSSEFADMGMNSVFGGGITDFTITTPDGTKYVFEEREISVGDDRGQNINYLPLDFIHECDPPFARPYRVDFDHARAAYTSWYLSKVINPYGKQEFQLHYDKEATVDHTGLNQQKSWNCDNSENHTYSSLVSTTLGKRLRRIEWGDIAAGNILGSLDFEANLFRFDLFYPDYFANALDAAGYEQGKALYKIIWKGADDSAIREIQFDYDYLGRTDISALPNCNIDLDNQIWTDRHRYRLKLESITERGWSATGELAEKPPYIFDYNDTPMPPRHSPQRDFWGYYNGNEANSLIPMMYAYPLEDGSATDIHNHYDLFRTIYSVYQRLPAVITDSYSEIVNYDGVDRTANGTFAKAGILEQINYPTGGFAHFDYELNEFRVQDLYNGDIALRGGGLRIAKITTSEGMGRTFDYRDDTGIFTSGRLIDMPLFAESYTNHCEGGNGGTPPPPIKAQTRISSGALTGLLTTKGGFVGYSKVTEQLVGDEDLMPNNGSITHYFSMPAYYEIDEDECDANGDCIYRRPTVQANITEPYADFYPYPPRPNYDWNRGHLERQEIRDAEGGMVREVVNTYEIFGHEKIYALKVSAPPPANIASLQKFALGKYYFISGDKRLVNTYTVDHQRDGTLRHTTDYGYSQHHHQPISTTTSNGAFSQTERIKYAPDITLEDGYNLLVSNTMINKHMIGLPLITTTSGEENTGSRVDYSFFNFYKILPQAYHRLLKDGTWELMGTIHEYNQDEFPTHYLANYYPDTIKYTWENDRMIRRDYIDWTRHFTHDPNTRMQTSVTEIDGQTTSFEYDGLQRLNRTTARNGNIINRISYGYSLLGDPGNTVSTQTIYSNLDDQEQVKYYDGLGRYVQTVNVGYGVEREDVVTNEIDYDGAGRAFYNFDYQTGGVITKFDDSPLNRKTKDILPDNSNIKYEYWVNRSSEVPGIAGAMLYKLEVVDENGNSNFTYTDFMDRQHMIKDAEGGDTRFGFDGFGNLESVNTPEGEVYNYLYDNFKRLESKTIPGGGTTIYDYYDNHLLRNSTDANNNVVQTFYDSYDRPELVQLNGEDIITYKYDTDVCGNTSTGRLTQKEVKVLDENRFLTTQYCYDQYGRQIQEQADNYVGGSDDIINFYDMADNLLAVAHEHQGLERRKIGKSYEYDHSFRLTKNLHAMSDNLEDIFTVHDFQTLSFNKYNNKDQLVQKNLHELGSGDFLQRIDYRYNSRAWLTDINQVKLDPDDVAIPSCGAVNVQPCFPRPACGGREVEFREVLKLRLLDKNLSLNCYQACDTVDLCDYTAPFSWGGFDRIDSIVADGNLVPLPNYPYPLQYDPVTQTSYYGTILPDLENWMTNNGYAVDSSTITFDGRSSVFTVFQTDLVFDAFYGFDISHGLGVQEALFNSSNCNSTTTCDTIEVFCDPEKGIAQSQGLSDMRESMANLKAADLSYPTQLHRVRLCSQEEVYLLNQELPQLTGNYQVLQTLNIDKSSSILNASTTKTTTSPESSNKDLFSLHLSYHQGNAALEAPGQRNGNVSSMQWKVRGHTPKAYGFQYDRINRLEKAKFAEYIYDRYRGCTITSDGRYDVWNIQYDKDGNLLSLYRKGVTDICPNGTLEFGEIDLLNYNDYDGNQLKSVLDQIPDEGGVTSALNAFAYDFNGNMLFNTGKGIDYIHYNYLNLPRQISFSSTGAISTVYDAEGMKLKKSSIEPGGATVDKYYIRGIEYSSTTGGIEAVYHDEGRIITDANGDYRYEYNLKDHLGNTRIIFSDLNDNGLIETDASNNGYSEILQEEHYYPFGMNMQGNFANQVGTENQYQYNGKELTSELGLNWNDYGARWYDAAIGRWSTVDPLAEDYYSHSPYNYVLNNPLKFIDPDGMQVDGDYFGSNGKYLGSDGLNDNKVHIVTDGAETEQLKKSLRRARKNGIDESMVFENSSLASTITITKAIVEGVVKSTEAMKKETSKGARDGGLHEEGGHSENGTVVFWKPGAKKDGKTENASIYLFNGVKPPGLENVEAVWHVHTNKGTPTGEMVDGQPEYLVGESGPSTKGKDSDTGGHTGMEAMGFKGVSIVSGGDKNRVHFYNGSGSYYNVPYYRFKKMAKQR